MRLAVCALLGAAAREPSTFEDSLALLQLGAQLRKPEVPAVLPASVKDKLEDANSQHLFAGNSSLAFDATAAIFSERGYASVARIHSDAKMKAYIRLIAAHEGLAMRSPEELDRMVPYYSGTCAKQNYAALLSELRRATKNQKCKPSWADQRQRPEVPLNLLQMSSSTAKESQPMFDDYDWQWMSNFQAAMASFNDAIQDFAEEASTHGRHEETEADFMSASSQPFDDRSSHYYEFRKQQPLEHNLLHKQEDADVHSSQGLTPEAQATDHLVHRKMDTDLDTQFANLLKAHHSFEPTRSGELAVKESYRAQRAPLATTAERTVRQRSGDNPSKKEIDFVGPEQRTTASASVEKEHSPVVPRQQVTESVNNGLASRAREMLKSQRKSEQRAGMSSHVGSVASLDEIGYHEVASTRDSLEMAMFALRALEREHLRLLSPEAFEYTISYHSGECATQSYAALIAEFHRGVYRPKACGGVWIELDD
jgi:hypothetical protein